MPSQSYPGPKRLFKTLRPSQVSPGVFLTTHIIKTSQGTQFLKNNILPFYQGISRCSPFMYVLTGAFWFGHCIHSSGQFHFISFLAITFCACQVNTCCHIQQHQIFGRLYDPCLSIRCSVFWWGQYPMFPGNNLLVYLLSYSHTGSTNPVWLSVFLTFPGGPFRRLQL